MFRDVFKLQNGEYFLYENGRLSIHKYFDAVDAFHVDEEPVLTEWEDKIASAFTESVEMHKISDVEVGCFLSSGVDSSYVVREVSKVTKDVKTFSVGYEEERYSELPYAQDFSRVIGVENISNKVSADEFFGMAGKIQYYMDEPLPNPSEIPLFFLAQNAAKYVKVVLSGEGRGRALRRVPDVSRGRAFRPLRPYPPGRCAARLQPWRNGCRISRENALSSGALWSRTSGSCGRITSLPGTSGTDT